jgi:3-dehydroquinate synthase
MIWREIDLRKYLFFKYYSLNHLDVQLRDWRYPIFFSQNVGQIFSTENSLTELRGRAGAILTDESIAASQRAVFETYFEGVPRLALPAGEKTKSLEQFGRVLDFLAGLRLGRDGLVWVIGGGVVGDLGGFAAASYLRGLDFVQVPTTLLAMVDSSIGGKTGINLAAGKNLVGAFHHPRAVLIATDFLQTLPAREFSAGMAEVIKYGLLGDEALFTQLERASLAVQSPALLPTIRRCCEMKAAIVQADERETAREGGRALLNLGHTFGHALEQVTGYESYLHGEAVAVGLAAAARLSAKLGHLTPNEVGRVEKTVAAHALPTRLRASLPVADLMAAMQHDKKVRSGHLRFVVLRRLGEAATQSDVDPALVTEVWRELGAT